MLPVTLCATADPTSHLRRAVVAGHCSSVRPEVTAKVGITVDCAGVTLSDRFEFDASWNRNDTFTFRLGDRSGDRRLR